MFVSTFVGPVSVPARKAGRLYDRIFGAYGDPFYSSMSSGEIKYLLDYSDGFCSIERQHCLDHTAEPMICDLALRARVSMPH